MVSSSAVVYLRPGGFGLVRSAIVITRGRSVEAPELGVCSRCRLPDHRPINAPFSKIERSGRERTLDRAQYEERVGWRVCGCAIAPSAERVSSAAPRANRGLGLACGVDTVSWSLCPSLYGHDGGSVMVRYKRRWMPDTHGSVSDVPPKAFALSSAKFLQL